jgi:imidazolonepropionase-like amidohydrolase
MGVSSCRSLVEPGELPECITDPGKKVARVEMTRLLFRNGHIFDGTGGPPAAADVVIEDGSIVDVGVGLDGDEDVDLGGRTLLPGLFDTHVHFTMSGELDRVKLMMRPFSLRYFEAVANMEATLRTGITSVREAGGSDLGVKTAVTRGLARGPRMQISIAMLSQTGGHGDRTLPSGGCFYWPHPFPGNPQWVVDGPDEMRRQVRELIREGAEVIKVATSGGVLSPRDDPRHGHFRDDELSVLVAEATAAGRYVMAHAQGTEGIKAAVRHGIRSIEHGCYLDDEAISMMLERGTWLVPTLSAPRAVLAASEAGTRMEESALRKTNEVLEVHTQSFRRAVEAGVKIAMGTDSGVGPHGRNLEELALMVDNSSMTPLDAWVTTTSSAAALCGVNDRLGTISPGKLADLTVVEGDLSDLHKLDKRVWGVWKDGVRVV